MSGASKNKNSTKRNIFEPVKEKFQKQLKKIELRYLLFPGIFGLLANWIGGLSRKEFGGSVGEAITGLLKDASLITKTLPVSFHPMDLLLLSVIMTIGYFVMKIEMEEKKRVYKKGEEYGSARWGTPEDAAQLVNPKFRNNIILTQTEFLTMEERPKNKKARLNKNILVVGGSGTGKTRSILKPNLMQMHSSYVITDPKGTILNECGYMLEKAGYKIKVLNLIDLSKSMRYNPIAYVKTDQDIITLIEAFISNTSGEEANKGEDFWVQAEKLLYRALIAGLLYGAKEEERNFVTVSNLLNEMEVREDDESFENAVDIWFKRLKKRSEKIKEQYDPDHDKYNDALNLDYAVAQYGKYKLAAGKTAKSVLITAAARMGTIDTPAVSRLFKYDELELTKLGTERTALFIIIPDTSKAFNFIASIMYTQLFNLLCTMADDKYGGQLPIHVRCLMDEFANIGKIPDWQVLIATIRSRRISATMVLQTKSQLKAIYGDHADTIIGNCDTEIFLGGKEESTIKSLSEGLGKQTINDRNKNDSRGMSPSVSFNESKLGKELLTPDEIKILDNDKCVLEFRGIRPFLSQKYDIETHPMFKYHSNEPGDSFWFIYEDYRRRLKLKAINFTEALNRKAQLGEIDSETLEVDLSYDENGNIICKAAS